MPLIISDMPFSDDMPQEEIDRRRAERMAKGRKTSRKKVEDEEKLMFPNLTGEFDEESPFARHFTGKRDE